MLSLKNAIKKVILVVIIFFLPSALWSKTKTSDAMLCSSLYYIVSSLAKDKAGQDILMRQQEIFNLIYISRKNRSVSNREISKLQHQHLMYLSDMYDKNPDEVYNIEMKCNAWRESFSSSLMRISKKAKNLKQIKRGFRKFPPMGTKTYNSSDIRWNDSKTMMDSSFKVWSQYGRLTPYSLKQ